MKRIGFGLLSAFVTVGLVATPATAKKVPLVKGASADCSAATSCTITWDDPSDLTIFSGSAVDAIDHSSPGTTAPGNSVTISGLDPTTRYYFELVPTGAKTGTIVADRSLHLESAPNARDIGGYETKDGHHVKWGVVFRSDEISKLTDTDTAKMAGFGIKIVCDFRGTSEVESRGADKVPAGAELVSLPVLDEGNTLAADIQDAITSKDFAAQERLLGNGKAEKILADAGPFLVSGSPARKAYTALLDRLTDPASLPALTHCTAGKDRTGWSTAVILTALGVPKATVMQDYLLTNELTKDKNAQTIKSVTPLMQDPQLLVPLLEVRAEYLNGSFAEVKKKYGTFDGYLRKGLGVSKADLAKLKKNLLTD
jgi:protein-tyrosine phosphatase